MRFEMMNDDIVKKYTAIEYSTKLNLKGVRFIPGGSAANIASDCAMMGIKSSYLGILGNDFSSKMCIDDLKKRGVETSNIQFSDEDNTAFSVILKAGWGKDRSIMAYKGANNLLSPEDIKENSFKNVKAFAWTSLTEESACKAIEKAIKITKKKNGRIFGAPSMSIIKNKIDWARKLIAQSNVVSLNKQEAQALYPSRDDTSLVKDFLDEGLDLISITDGDKGSIVSDGKKIINSSIFDIKTKDTTGAGDAFMSGLIISHFNDFDLEKTIQFASAMSAFEARELGVREGLPESNEVVEKFLNKNSLKQVISEFK